MIFGYTKLYIIAAFSLIFCFFFILNHGVHYMRQREEIRILKKADQHIAIITQEYDDLNKDIKEKDPREYLDKGVFLID